MTDKKKADPKASRNDTNNSSSDGGHLIRFLDAVKNASERVRIDVKTYRGNTYIDIRVWYVDAAGEYHPSSKGVMVKPTLAPELLRGIALAAQSFDPKEAA
ncbi:transcriptional coactivator p15 (PC4) [Paraburkholderia sp. BL6665CI2N2]|uniref:transcriptional coactivator p15/PC4 family protein n=1 Tax=Paraburkholderia sp. BL6665CI2N2 TaxID=1938806 RepID=UPI001064E86A|nr:transcriptional coactivator p15/PC4 family protein [Paraburkholderia sp. BL6665CI2N2]TDY23928.1 transcriptional coactivator p15 (PC4) [Paraburkholderia sp. BL6665CI2N2]